MSAPNKEASPDSQPQGVSSRRPLFKGTLRPPPTNPTCKSYTLTPASASEVSIKDPAGKQATSRSSIAISSIAVPQPFVDPASLQRRQPPS